VAKRGTGFGRQGTEAAGSEVTAAGKEELLGSGRAPRSGRRLRERAGWRVAARVVASRSLAGQGRARQAFAGLIRSKAIFA
jgi:hypothetical protein